MSIDSKQTMINVGSGDNTGAITVKYKIEGLDIAKDGGIKIGNAEMLVEATSTMTDAGQKDLLDYIKSNDQLFVAGVSKVYNDFAPGLLKMFNHLVDKKTKPE